MTDSECLLTDSGLDGNSGDVNSSQNSRSTRASIRKDEAKLIPIIVDPEGNTYNDTHEGQAMKLISELDEKMSWLNYPDNSYLNGLVKVN